MKNYENLPQTIFCGICGVGVKKKNLTYFQNQGMDYGNPIPHILDPQGVTLTVENTIFFCGPICSTRHFESSKKFGHSQRTSL